ncbi:AMP-binding protein, partial [Thalassobaculum salexigens]|uniref:AMP-binding protein n=1 Tax=Thalassobaculum salexigens TaxID=455360 RepID=UPI00248DA5D1
MTDAVTKLWEPSPDRAAAAQITAFMEKVNADSGAGASDYDSLWQWSVDNPEVFWSALWDFGGVVGEKGAVILSDPTAMPGAKFFPQGKVNFAENLLRRSGDGDALVFWGEDQVKLRYSWDQLREQVARLAAAFKAEGVGPGDRVAAFMPNMPQTIIAMLAATSLGAVWSSCSPDFGVQGVLDRFGQIEP